MCLIEKFLRDLNYEREREREREREIGNVERMF